MDIGITRTNGSPPSASARCQHQSDQPAANDLHSQLTLANAERRRLGEQIQSVMDLIGCTEPERLIHDLRNVLNERALLKSLVEAMEQ